MTRFLILTAVGLLLFTPISKSEEEALTTVYVHNSDVAATKVVFRNGQRPTIEIWFTPAKKAELAKVMRKKHNWSVAFIDVLTSSGSRSIRQSPAFFEEQMDDLASTLKFAQDLTGKPKVKLPSPPKA
jgi:hypothetical protein